MTVGPIDRNVYDEHFFFYTNVYIERKRCDQATEGHQFEENQAWILNSETNNFLLV